jgi:flagellar motor switch protein FliN/FliY
MSSGEITQREALMRLGASTAAAVAQVLDTLAPGLIERGEVSVLADGVSPFANLPLGAVAASVSYVDGVTGANVFVMPPAGARALANSMMGMEPPEPSDEELSDLELSAVSEAANQMMAAAAGAISVVLGQQVEISVPETRLVDDTKQATDFFGTAPHATSTTFLVAGESCRLVQLVPSAFVVRMARAIDEMSMETSGPHGAATSARAGQNGHASESVGLHEALSDIRLRVWAELGRTRLPLGGALELPPGAVVDLDRAADAPVDLFVNGLRFAQGHLLVTDDGEWAVCLDQLGSASSVRHTVVAATTSTMKGTPS